MFMFFLDILVYKCSPSDKEGNSQCSKNETYLYSFDMKNDTIISRSGPKKEEEHDKED